MVHSRTQVFILLRLNVPMSSLRAARVMSVKYRGEYKKVRERRGASSLGVCENACVCVSVRC